MASTKTTEEDFKQYVAHCKWWMVKLSICEYTYRFIAENATHPASVTTTDEMLAEVGLALERDDWVSIPMLARHEMLEVLVDDSFKDAYAIYNDDYVQAKRHKLIHRLEKILPIPSDKEVGYVGKKKKKAKKEKEMPCGKKKKPKGK